jgi:hypothetical protein
MSGGDSEGTLPAGECSVHDPSSKCSASIASPLVTPQFQVEYLLPQANRFNSDLTYYRTTKLDGTDIKCPSGGMCNKNLKVLVFSNSPIGSSVNWLSSSVASSPTWSSLKLIVGIRPWWIFCPEKGSDGSMGIGEYLSTWLQHFKGAVYWSMTSSGYPWMDDATRVHRRRG